MNNAQTTAPSSTSDNELLAEFKDLLAVTAREVSEAATVPALESVFQQWTERLATLTQGVTALHDQTLTDYRAWESERQTTLGAFREKLQQSQTALTDTNACCRETQSFLQGVHQQGEAALKTNGQLVEEFLRIAGQRAAQMAQAVDSVESWFAKQAGQWESLLLDSNDKVTKLNRAVDRDAEQSAAQARAWKDLLERSNQTLAEFTQAIQAKEKRLAEESAAWRAAITDAGERVSRLTQTVENADTAFRKGVATLEEQTRLLVKEHETTNQGLSTAADIVKKAGDDFHLLLSAVVKKFNEICTTTSGNFEHSALQSSATLAAVHSVVQDSNARLRAIEVALGKQASNSDEPIDAVILGETKL